MEKNCRHYIKIEPQGKMIVYWRCLNDALTCGFCEEHEKWTFEKAWKSVTANPWKDVKFQLQCDTAKSRGVSVWDRDTINVDEELAKLQKGFPQWMAQVDAICMQRAGLPAREVTNTYTYELMFYHKDMPKQVAEWCMRRRGIVIECTPSACPCGLSPML